MAFILVAALALLAADSPVGNKTGVIRSAEEIPAPGVTESSVFIEIPHIRQETNLCVPTSAAMVLEYFGDPQPPRKLKGNFGFSVFHEGSTDPENMMPVFFIQM